MQKPEKNLIITYTVKEINLQFIEISLNALQALINEYKDHPDRNFMSLSVSDIDCEHNISVSIVVYKKINNPNYAVESIQYQAWSVKEVEKSLQKKIDQLTTLSQKIQWEIEKNAVQKEKGQNKLRRLTQRINCLKIEGKHEKEIESLKIQYTLLEAKMAWISFYSLAG